MENEMKVLTAALEAKRCSGSAGKDIEERNARVHGLEGSLGRAHNGVQEKSWASRGIAQRATVLELACICVRVPTQTCAEARRWGRRRDEQWISRPLGMADTTCDDIDHLVSRSFRARNPHINKSAADIIRSPNQDPP